MTEAVVTSVTTKSADKGHTWSAFGGIYITVCQSQKRLDLLEAGSEACCRNPSESTGLATAGLSAVGTRNGLLINIPCRNWYRASFVASEGRCPACLHHKNRLHLFRNNTISRQHTCQPLLCPLSFSSAPPPLFPLPSFLQMVAICTPTKCMSTAMIQSGTASS